jgi:hypothetical protein
MSYETFRMLADALRPYMTRQQRKYTHEQRIARVVYYFAHPTDLSAQSEHWSASQSTLSADLHEVLSAIISFLRQTGWARPTHPDALINDPDFRFFRGCVGALDGTLIPITIPSGGLAGWMCRKGYTAQNVLVACNFNLQVIFCLAGAEGLYSFHILRA